MESKNVKIFSHKNSMTKKESERRPLPKVIEEESCLNGKRKGRKKVEL